MSWLDRIAQFQQSKVYALSSSVAVVSSLVVALMLETAMAGSALSAGLLALDSLLCSVFIAEYMAGVASSSHKGRYALLHLYDLLGAVPMAIAYIPVLRLLRVFRLLRLLRLLRLGLFVGVLMRAWVKELKLHPAQALGAYSTVVLTLGSVGFYLTEKGANDQVSSIGEALWLSVVTLTTVGYGDIYPVTWGGRVFGSVLAIMGIGLLASLTGAIAGHMLAAAEPESAAVENQSGELE